jgi:hypothetical protein
MDPIILADGPRLFACEANGGQIKGEAMRDTRQIASSGSAWPCPRLRLTAALILAALSGLAGCAHRPPPIQPWQREYLSKRALRFDADPFEARFRQHMFGSREGADGGYGHPGGGCGCN